MLNEVKKFAMRGNLVDMAVGIIIGAAFGKIVSSAANTCEQYGSCGETKKRQAELRTDSPSFFLLPYLNRTP